MTEPRSVSQRIRALGTRLSATLTESGQPLAWTLRGYRRQQIGKDGIGGLTVAALIIPLSIGYAQVAGLPPEAGLYASLVPLVAYAVFGSSRRLIVGPDAATAALVGAAIAPLAVAADDRMRMASALALLVAVVFVAMRLAALGFLSEFLSRPLLVGYMTGVGINVAMGQIPKILGGSPLADFVTILGNIDFLHVEPSAVVGALGVALSQVSGNLPSAILGGLVLAAILAGERWLPRVPMALPALLVALAATAILDLPSDGVRILGPVPSGLPPIALPLISLDQALGLLPAALGIAVLSFADTALTGRNFAEPHGERTDPNRELVALAAADLGGSLTSGYPISSSASRTQASEAAGSQTQMAGIIAAGAVSLVLLFLTGPLALLPIPALGAIVLAGALHFIKFREIARISRIQASEGAIAIVAATCVVLYGTLVGVGVAALLAAFNVFRRAADPHIAELGRLAGDEFGDIERSPTARRTRGVLVVRFAGPLFFATATALGDRVRGLAASREPLKVVVLDAYAVVDLDLTATDAIRSIERELAKSGTTLVIARPTGALRDLMRTLGLGHLAPAHGEHVTLAHVVDEASAAAEADLPVEDLADGSAEPADEIVEVAPEPTSATGPAPWPPSGDRPEPPRSRPKVGIVAIATIVVVGVAIAALALGQRTTVPPQTGEVLAPNLVGIPYERARSSTESAGLVLGPAIFRQTDAYPEGTVISQSPGPGTPMAYGTAITPTVSTARELIAVPDVVGSPQSDAIFAITTAGLRVGSTTRAPDAAIPAGAVLSTDPDAGRSVAVGTSVALIVSSGPAVPGSPTATPTATAPPSAGPGATPPPSPSAPINPGGSSSPGPGDSPAPSAGPGESPTPLASPTPS